MKLIEHTFSTNFKEIEITEKRMNNEDFQLCYNAFGAVIKDEQSRILIQKHVKYDMYTIPIGKCPINVQHDTGLRRELVEECGITARTLLKLDEGNLIFQTSDNKQIIIVTCLIKVLSYLGEVKNLEPHKHEIQKFMTIDEIKEHDRLSYVTQLYLNNFV